MRLLLIEGSLAAFGIIGIVCCALFYEQSRDVHKRHQDKHVVCDDNSCSLLLESRYYHLFVVPNWWYGTAFYGIVLIASFSRNPVIDLLAFAGSVASCVVSIYLIWALVFKLKTVCRVCYTAHAANLLILISLLVRHAMA
jgi:uncharacterized membrane protein